MAEFERLLQNRVLGTALLAWLIAQGLKVMLVALFERRLDLSRMIGSGGMPSSHAAFVVSLGFGVGFEAGFDSPLFALAAVFALVVMYDAAGVRRAVGRQARLLNRIVTESIEERHLPPYEQLKELLGHTPVEVFAGAVLGAMIAAWRL
ncbi:MAG: divergent PAP2 family protein [Oscillospiraceae bacterium]|jgi:acid phosphatase family membrane protein YuiD|nr:divergent PAP2 family protein [Oscillospiraceae bacterium]